MRSRSRPRPRGSSALRFTASRSDGGLDLRRHDRVALRFVGKRACTASPRRCSRRRRASRRPRDPRAAAGRHRASRTRDPTAETEIPVALDGDPRASSEHAEPERLPLVERRLRVRSRVTLSLRPTTNGRKRSRGVRSVTRTVPVASAADDVALDLDDDLSLAALDVERADTRRGRAGPANDRAAAMAAATNRRIVRIVSVEVWAASVSRP